MFTGIIQNQGRVLRKEKRGGQIRFSFRLVRKEIRTLRSGESIAVNGVCLTACPSSDRIFTADVIGETLASTTLGNLRKGERVNLERSLRLGDPLGGHFVTGHADGIGRIVQIKRAGKNRTFSVQTGPAILRFVAPKGSITVDGVSLTVQKVKKSVFEIGMVPHTLRETTLSRKKTGDPVNLEVDLIARYLNLFSDFLKDPKRQNRASLTRFKKQGF